MYFICLIIYLLVAISLVLLIMLQYGSGIDIGEGNSFNFRGVLGGIGNSITSNFMTRLTTVLGVLFFFLSLLLGNINNKSSNRDLSNDRNVLKESNNVDINHVSDIKQ